MKSFDVRPGATHTDLYFDLDLRMNHEVKRRGGRWDPEKSCWSVPNGAADKLVRHAERLGYTVT